MLLLESLACFIAESCKVPSASDDVAKAQGEGFLESPCNRVRALVLKPDDIGERKGFETTGSLIVHMSMNFEGLRACRVMGTLDQVVHPAV
ncbi:MAG: hypothetical protein EHM80_13335 [Nitrospiraceae bacterium]|nr:MAG: hypothetical protein EHM80_13335 [Nitrospiraceae bacterium]